MSFEAQPAPAATSQPQALNGRYVAEEKIDERAFFVTWRGRDLRSSRPVFLQFLRPEYSREPEFVERLLQHARAAGRLEGPNVVPVLDVFTERGSVIVVCAAARGVNLRERIRRVAPFPLAVAVDIAISCAEGLESARRQEQVHGDVRPENILVTPEGEVKLDGFGVGPALAASSRSQLASLAELAPYQAPERSEGREPDARSDIYSVGIVLYEMLAGAPPFQAETSLGVAVKHLHETPPSLSARSPGIPRAVEGLVLKCLQKNPQSRYESFADLLGDLNLIREGLRFGKPLAWSPVETPAQPSRSAFVTPEPSPAAPPPMPFRPAEPEPGEPSGKLLFIGFLGVLMVAAAAFFVGWVMLRTPPDVSVPDVRGQSRASAVAVLERFGLKASIQEKFHERVPADTVYAQTPDARRAVKQGNTVDLWVSKGPQPVTIPDVLGKDLAAARDIIREAGLVPGPIHEQFSDVHKKGEVITQDINPGGTLPRGGILGLTVSKGAEPIPQPRPVDVRVVDRDSQTDPGTGETPPRQWDVIVRVPATPNRMQQIRVIVLDNLDNEHEEYSQDHAPGEEVHVRVTDAGIEGTVRLRVLIDGKVVHAQRF